MAAALPNLHTRALKLGDTTSLAGVWCALLAGFRLTRSTSTASPLDPVEGCAQALLLFLIVLIFLISIISFAQNSLPPIYSAILIAAISHRADKPFTPHPPTHWPFNRRAGTGKQSTDSFFPGGQSARPDARLCLRLYKAEGE